MIRLIECHRTQTAGIVAHHIHHWIIWSRFNLKYRSSSYSYNIVECGVSNKQTYKKTNLGNIWIWSFLHINRCLLMAYFWCKKNLLVIKYQSSFRLWLRTYNIFLSTVCTFFATKYSRVERVHIIHWVLMLRFIFPYTKTSRSSVSTLHQEITCQQVCNETMCSLYVRTYFCNLFYQMYSKFHSLH